MRRLVVISGKSKIIAIFAATVFSLTSIHLAAKAHIASLQREQEQFERSVMQRPSRLLRTPNPRHAIRQRSSWQVRQRSIRKSPPQRPRQSNLPSHRQPSITAPHPPPDARSLSALRTVNWPSSITARS